MKDIMNYINQSDIREKIKQVVGNEKEVNILIADILEIIKNNSLLQKCDPVDIFALVLKAEALKLPLNDSLGYVYLVPYKHGDRYKPVFIIGYKGLIQLALRTGQYKTIHADIIYEGETVKKDKITGEISIEGNPINSNVIGYIAYLELVNGFKKALYMSKDDIIKHAKKYSRTFNSEYSPWSTNFDDMALKTVLRKLLTTYGIKSVEFLAQEVEEEYANKMIEEEPVIEESKNEQNNEESKNEQNNNDKEIPF